ncbi:MAG: RNA polymerase sigma factor [Sphingomonadales bacterium]
MDDDSRGQSFSIEDAEATQTHSDDVEALRQTPLSQPTEPLSDAYQAYFAPLVAWLHHAYGAGPPEPEDVAQRAFANLAQRRDLSDVENVKAFVWRSARNIVVSEKRLQMTRNKASDTVEALFSGDQGDVLSPARVLETKDMLNKMISAIGDMPEQRRRAYILHRIEGMRYTDAARRLGISRTAVTKHVALASLDIQRAQRRFYKDPDEDDV